MGEIDRSVVRIEVRPLYAAPTCDCTKYREQLYEQLPLQRH